VNRRFRRREGDDRRAVGTSSEEAAWRHLERAGYSLVARNFRSRFGEIDLVVERAGVVVFVEVRSRRGERYGSALESVDRRKQRQIGRMALEFVARRRLLDRRARFDVVAIEWQDGEPRIDHVENAFELVS
jgi:putative endonuclease